MMILQKSEYRVGDSPMSANSNCGGLISDSENELALHLLEGLHVKGGEKASTHLIKKLCSFDASLLASVMKTTAAVVSYILYIVNLITMDYVRKLISGIWILFNSCTLI
ncbi:uncharacterized protein [Rutidosis leptorrhynchoides]|uniref:uncharacterized protein isoform X2 n=1 Tax=Rutidosis leptorrhynchoides TaxID=125765 RepID=UPI003A990041